MAKKTAYILKNHKKVQVINYRINFKNPQDIMHIHNQSVKPIYNYFDDSVLPNAKRYVLGKHTRH